MRPDSLERRLVVDALKGDRAHLTQERAVQRMGQKRDVAEYVVEEIRLAGVVELVPSSKGRHDREPLVPDELPVIAARELTLDRIDPPPTCLLGGRLQLGTSE